MMLTQPGTRESQNTAGKGRSFQALVFSRFAIAGFVLAIIAAFAYSYMSSTMIKDFYEKEGIQATENFAGLSELALLYESGDNARDAATATLNFPSIKHVAIIDSNNQILLDEGNTDERILTDLEESQWVDDKAQLFSTSSSTWQIAAPVYTQHSEEFDEALLLDEEPQTKTYLGYVAIQIDSSQVRDFQQTIFVRNLIVGLGYGLVFAAILSLALRRLFQPMRRLARVMQASTDGAYKNSVIEKDSPLEITQIAEVYNQMITNLAERDQKLRGQKDLLETEVALRTSELVQARDAALEANRLKSEFLANITHELRTPLQSIIGYTEVVNEMLEDEGVFSCETDIQKITRNAEHLLGLINSILDISKIEAGKIDIHTQQTNVKSLLLATIETATPLAQQNGNTITTDINSVDLDVMIDDKKLYQILLNLLSNAAKFTRDGRITVTASYIDDALVCSVEDTGIGISPENQKMVFEPFRQIDGGNTREFVGTGLGLSISLRFARLLGGSIQLVSEQGKGSRFTLTIPCGLAAEQMAVNQ